MWLKIWINEKYLKSFLGQVTLGFVMEQNGAEIAGVSKKAGEE